MRTRNGEKFKLESVEELLGIQNEESAMDIEIEKICPFRKHPFKVIDDEKMQELVESIKTNGSPHSCPCKTSWNGYLRNDLWTSKNACRKTGWIRKNTNDHS